jgi:hypothetical protein
MAFMDDNLSQIQAFFTQGILTPATVIAWDEYDPDNETSLLGVSQKASFVYRPNTTTAGRFDKIPVNSQISRNANF